MLDIGKKLKEKRLEEGLSKDDIQDKTKLNITIIEALEEGDLHPFSEDLTYVKYYVRSYAKAVNLDFEEIEDDLENAIHGHTQAIDILEEERKEEISKKIEEKNAVIQNQSKKSKTGLKHKSGHIDWTLVSLISIVVVVVVFVVYALFVKGVTKPDEEPTKPPVIEEPVEDIKEDEEDTEEDKKEPEVIKVDINKVDPTTYELSHWQDADDFSIAVDFNVDTWIAVLKNDVQLDDPVSKVYNKGESISISKDLEENDRITIVFGILNSNVVKINNEEYVLDDSIKDVTGRVEVTFILMGEDNESTE